MKICRLFSTLLVMMLLLLPLGALAEAVPQVIDVSVIYETGFPDENTGLPQTAQAVYMQDYIWDMVDGNPSYIWIKLQPTSLVPRDKVRVVVTATDGMFPTTYTLVDPMNPNPEGWIDLSFSDMDGMPAPSFALQAEDGSQLGSLQLTMSHNDMPGVEPTQDLFGNNENPTWPTEDNPTEPTYYDPTPYEPTPEKAPDTFAGVANFAASQSSNDPINPDPPPDPDQTMPPRETEMGRVNNSDTVLYAAPGVPMDPPVTLKAQDVVTYYEDDTHKQYFDEATRKYWLPVFLSDNTTVGYLTVDTFTFMTALEKQDYLNSLKPDQQELPQRESNYARVKVDGAVLKGTNGTQTTLRAEDVVLYAANKDSYYNDDAGKLWLLVTVESDGRTGHVTLDAIQFMTYEEQQDHLKEPDKQTLPARESNYAYIINDGAVFKSTNGTQITLAKDAIVLYEAKNDSFYNDANGKLWLLVTTQDNRSGHVMLDDLRFMTAAEEKDHLKPTAPPKEEMPARESDYANVTSAEAQLVDSTGKNIRALNTSNVVIYSPTIGSFYDTDNKLYIPVTVDDGSNATGYVKLGYTYFMTRTQEEAYKKSKVTEAPVTKAPTNPPTDAPTKLPTATPPLAQQSGYMRVNVSYAPLVSWPDLGANILSVLINREVVYVQSQTYDSGGNIWSYASTLSQNSQWGYIQHKFLTPMSVSEVNAYFATPRPVPTTAPTYTPDSFSGYGVLTSNRVNFRSSPSASNNNNVLRQLSQGTIVRVLSQTSAGGYTWYQCESNGSIGYLRNDMMSLLSIREYQLLASQPSYDKNGSIITPTATANLNGPNAPTWSTPKPGATSTITFVTLPPSTSSPNPSASASPDGSASPDPNASPTASDGSILGTDTSPSPDPNATLPPPLDLEPTFPEEASGGFSPPSLLIALGALAVLGGGGLYGYSVYNKSRRKQTEEAAKQVASTGTSAQGGKPGDSTNPAVRRPVPPTTPPGVGATQNKNNQQSGQPGQQQTRSGAPGTRPGGTASTPTQPGQNPYARPQSQQQPPQRTQDVNSTLPRAQVDGRPAGTPGSTTGQPGAPYTRPQTPGQNPQPGQTQQQQPGQRPQAQGTTPQRTPGQAQQPPQQPGTQGSRPSAPTDANGYRQRMPIAPDPVEPDTATTSPSDDSPAPRRRRRRQAMDEANKTNDDS